MRSRRFAIAAVVAAFAMVICVPVSRFTFGDIDATSFASSIGGGIALALVIGFVAARFFPHDRIPLLVGFCALVLLLVPTGLAISWAYDGISYEAQESAVELQSHEPIVTTDELGLCEPPVFTSNHGRPAVRFAVRVPERDRYEFGFKAVDSEGRVYSDYAAAVLDPGVNELELVADSGSPKWPVTLQSIVVSTLDYVTSPICRCEMPRWQDKRNGVLAVLNGP